MKRSEAARYARWSALAAVVLAGITGIIYLQRQWVARVEIRRAPPPLTEDKERQSIGLTLSKNEGDRTIFTVQASKSTDFKGKDLSLLEDVKITVFGKLGDRHDVIHTRSCNYDKASGGIQCAGAVEMDLQSAADAERVKGKREALENVIHVETSGVTFEKATGRAQTPQPVKFSFANGDGEGLGAEYFSEQGVLRLVKDVRITLRPEKSIGSGKGAGARGASRTEGPTARAQNEQLGSPRASGQTESGANNGGEPPRENRSGQGGMAVPREVVLRGTRLEMGKKTRRMVLFGPATATTARQELTAGEITADLDSQYRTQTLLAVPGNLNQRPELTSQGTKGPEKLTADQMTADLTPQGWVRTIEIEGHLEGTSAEGEMLADSETVEMWPRVNQARLVTLRGNVRVDGHDLKTGLGRKLTTNTLQMTFSGGKANQKSKLQHAETLERGSVEWSDPDGVLSNLSADKLAVDFGEAGKAQHVAGTGNVETRRAIPEKPTETATAARGDVLLDEAGGWTQMTLRDNVRLMEGMRNAEAQQAVFARRAQTAVLTGQAVARDESSETKATRITFHQGTGDIEAEGRVTSTDLGPKKASIELSPAPANITADRMTGNAKTGRVVYTGHRARMWQGPSVLEAKTIELLRDSRELHATGDVLAVFPQENSGTQGAQKPAMAAPQQPAETANRSGQAGGGPHNGTTEKGSWHINCGKLTYWDNENRAHLEQNVVAQSAEQRMRAPVLDLYFTRTAAETRPGAGGKPTQKQRPVSLPPSGQAEGGLYNGGVSATAPGTAQISRAVGTGGVVVEEGERRGTAERGVYTAEDNKFVLSGGTPTIYDATEGTTTGRELTLNLVDDTIIVDSGNGMRTVTKHRVQK